MDACPLDANKHVTVGNCGCGFSDADSDGDGTHDCNDKCPKDPFKVFPGVCGCGTDDLDRDKNDVPDCIDTCAHRDSDGDGTNNCDDLCPFDAAKTAPGACGCDESEADSDGDGNPDCIDGCPNNAAKQVPGQCGCAVADVDSDGDKTPDCHDGCPADPAKTSPGTNGCGVPEDDDGVSADDDGKNPPASDDDVPPTTPSDQCDNGCSCVHIVSGACHGFIPNTAVCPPGTHPCKLSSGADTPMCGGCHIGSLGPCQSSNTVCYGYFPDEGTCPSGTTACVAIKVQAVTVESSDTYGYFSVQLDGIDSRDFHMVYTTAFVRGVAQVMSVAPEDVELKYVMQLSGEAPDSLGRRLRKTASSAVVAARQLEAPAVEVGFTVAEAGSEQAQMLTEAVASGQLTTFMEAAVTNDAGSGSDSSSNAAVVVVAAVRGSLVTPTPPPEVNEDGSEEDASSSSQDSSDSSDSSDGSDGSDGSETVIITGAQQSSRTPDSPAAAGVAPASALLVGVVIVCVLITIVVLLGVIIIRRRRAQAERGRVHCVAPPGEWDDHQWSAAALPTAAASRTIQRPAGAVASQGAVQRYGHDILGPGLPSFSSEESVGGGSGEEQEHGSVSHVLLSAPDSSIIATKARRLTPIDESMEPALLLRDEASKSDEVAAPVPTGPWLEPELEAAVCSEEL